MVLSDVAIRRLIESGRIVVEPYDAGLMQPSSLDVRVDRLFRVFRNSRYPFIDVKQEQEELTELVTVDGDEPFILHPGEFVLGSTLERIVLPDDLVARLEGKALALDTEVPTPDGWRMMRELRIGNSVFDETGAPTSILASTEPMVGRPCREVVFSDGTRVVCDSSHQWVTVDKNGRRYGKRQSRVVTTEEIARTLTVRGEFNHQVDLAGPAWYPERELPIEPYVRPQRTRPVTNRIGGQRMALLEELMDTDGYVDKLGRCDSTTVDDTLALQYAELVTSLGFRAIVDVREVPSVPVRCIQVAAPSGQFLVTRSYVPTHNSSLGRLGLLIHSTAGFIDPGWDGHVTLELSNVANLPITIYPEMKIGQLSFVQLSEPAEKPYGSGGLGSKYQGQRGPTPSRYWKNFAGES